MKKSYLYLAIMALAALTSCTGKSSQDELTPEYICSLLDKIDRADSLDTDSAMQLYRQCYTTDFCNAISLNNKIGVFGPYINHHMWEGECIPEVKGPQFMHCGGSVGGYGAPLSVQYRNNVKSAKGLAEFCKKHITISYIDDDNAKVFISDIEPYDAAYDMYEVELLHLTRQNGTWLINDYIRCDEDGEDSFFAVNKYSYLCDQINFCAQFIKGDKFDYAFQTKNYEELSGSDLVRIQTQADAFVHDLKMLYPTFKLPVSPFESYLHTASLPLKSD